MATRAPPLGRLLRRVVAAALVPVTLGAGAMTYWYYGHEKAEVTEGMELAAAAISGTLDERFARLQLQLDGLARALANRNTPRAEALELAGRMRDLADLDTVLLVSAGGTQIIDTDAASGQPPTRPSEPLTGAIRGGRAVVNDLVFVRGKPMVGVAVPVLEGNRIVYSLNGLLDVERFRAMVQGHGLPLGWIATIVDREGHIVARSDGHADSVGRPYPWALTAGASAGRLDFGTGAAAYARSNWTGWSVVLEAPGGELYRGLRSALAWVMLGLALLAVFSLWLVSRYSNRILDSVAMLVGEARQAAMGLPVDLPQLAFREANEFADLMDQAATEVHQSTMALERSERQLRAVLETAMDAIAVVDRDGNVVLFNDEAERMFRIRREQIVGRPVELLMPERYRDMHAAMVQRFAREPGAARSMGRQRLVYGLRANGDEFPIEASISSARADSDHWMTVIMRDVAKHDRGELPYTVLGQPAANG